MKSGPLWTHTILRRIQDWITVETAPDCLHNCQVGMRKLAFK